MKVLHLLDADQYYGSAAVVHDLAIAQRMAGINAEVLCIRPKDSAPGSAVERMEASHILTHSWPLAKFASFTGARKIIDFAMARGINLLHSHSYKTNILLGLLRKQRRLPALATLHGYTDARQDPMLFLYYMLERIALRRLDAIVAVSDAAGQQFSHDWPGTKQLTIANGLLVEDSMRPGQTQTPIEEIVIGSIGRLSEEKNYALLISAFAEFCERTPKAHLVIAGEGPQQDKLTTLIDKLGIGEQVTLAGYVTDIRSLISQWTVYVNCSRTEGLAVSLLEVMSAGCPIVASDIQANRALLAESNLGILFHANDAHALSTALDHATNLSLRDRDSLVARQRTEFEQRYTAEVMSASYARVYENLLCEHNSNR